MRESNSPKVRARCLRRIGLKGRVILDGRETSSASWSLPGGEVLFGLNSGFSITSGRSDTRRLSNRIDVPPAGGVPSSVLTLRTLLSVSTVTLVWAYSWNAAAQAQSTPSAALSGPPSASQAPADSESATAAPALNAEFTTEPTAEWKKAMALYDIGKIDESLETLRTKILICESDETPTCTDSERAALYLCIGIVLSGGQNNHKGGVRAFRKSLALDERMRVAPEYSTAPVVKAFSEAYGKPSQASIPKATPAFTSPGRYDQGFDDEDDEDDEENRDPEKAHLFWMATGGARYGLGNGGTTTQVGGALALAGLPGETSAFTLGARIRSGVLFSPEPTLGYLGLQMLIGGTIGPRKYNQFTFITGAVGFENYFDDELSALTGHFFTGTSLGGTIISGGVDFAAGSGIAYAIVGLEVGFGMLVH